MDKSYKITSSQTKSNKWMELHTFKYKLWSYTSSKKKPRKNETKCKMYSDSKKWTWVVSHHRHLCVVCKLKLVTCLWNFIKIPQNTVLFSRIVEKQEIRQKFAKCHTLPQSRGPCGHPIIISKVIFDNPDVCVLVLFVYYYIFFDPTINFLRFFTISLVVKSLS